MFLDLSDHPELLDKSSAVNSDGLTLHNRMDAKGCLQSLYNDGRLPLRPLQKCMM